MLAGHFVSVAVALWKVVSVVLQVLAGLTHCHPMDLVDPENHRRLPGALLVLQVAEEFLGPSLKESGEMRLRQAWSLGLLWARSLLMTSLSVRGSVINDEYPPAASDSTDLARLALELDREGTSRSLVRQSTCDC